MYTPCAHHFRTIIWCSNIGTTILSLFVCRVPSMNVAGKPQTWILRPGAARTARRIVQTRRRKRGWRIINRNTLLVMSLQLKCHFQSVFETSLLFSALSCLNWANTRAIEMTCFFGQRVSSKKLEILQKSLKRLFFIFLAKWLAKWSMYEQTSSKCYTRVWSWSGGGNVMRLSPVDGQT